MPRALICGISGQDGAYLARFLLSKGYEVVGTSRDAQIASFANLGYLGIAESVQLESMALTDFRSVLQVVSKTAPDEIYNLAGQSSVGLSFQQPVETLESVALGTLNLLEVSRFIERPLRIYNAASSEMFGDTGDEPANEESPFRPRSPYAVAKATSFWEVANYRDAYGLFACSGILYNHESPLRPERFVTRKIVKTACRIARGSDETLRLGNVEIERDWGWAPEFVEAMWLMLNQDSPRDFVIATGEANRLSAFADEVFSQLGLNWKDHVELDASFLRPSDIRKGFGNPALAEKLLGWRATKSMKDVARMMVAAEQARTG